MSKRKISLKNSLLKIIEVFLIVIMIATVGNPKSIVAEGPLREQTVPVNQYFAVRKTWVNDEGATGVRPTSITVKVINKADPSTVVATGTLTEENGWKADFSLPAYSTGTTDLIQYAVYEDSIGLDKYIMTNPQANPLDITKYILREDSSKRKSVTEFVVNNKGFDAVPKGNVLISTDLDLSKTYSKTMDENIFKYEDNGFRIYGDVESYTNNYKRIIYTGDLKAGENELKGKEIVLYWKDRASNVLTGQVYDVRITFSQIVINAKAAINNSEATESNKKYVALIGFGDLLETNAYYGPTYNPWEKNFPGVKMNVKIEVLDKNGEHVDGFTEMYMSDLDQPDYFDQYNNEGGKNTNREKYFGVERNWIEGFRIEDKEGVVSELYLNTTSDLGVINNENGVKFACAHTPTIVGGVEPPEYTSVKFLVKTDGTFNYDWYGSNCGTAIVTSSGSATPDIKTFTNYITNTTAFYEIRYFFQNDDGTYNEGYPEPVEGPIAIRPSTESSPTYVSVENNAKTNPTDVDPSKVDYVLDESLDPVRTKVKEQKEVTTEHKFSAPQVLNVYFKKAYRVTYHDNVEDEVWNAKEKQNNPGLDYGVNTPVFDGTKSAADVDGNPIRDGYKFLGWSETPTGDIITIPAKVTKNADYWAHWEALPNQYTVQYFYEKDGVYPKIPDYELDEPRRDKKTDEIATIIESDKIPNSEKPNYYLNSAMTSEWSKPVKGDGSTILKVYFKQRKETIKIPVTGID